MLVVVVHRPLNVTTARAVRRRPQALILIQVSRGREAFRNPPLALALGLTSNYN